MRLISKLEPNQKLNKVPTEIDGVFRSQFGRVLYQGFKMAAEARVFNESIILSGRSSESGNSCGNNVDSDSSANYENAPTVSSSRVNVIVRNLAGDIWQLECKKDDSVKAVKFILQELLQFPWVLMKLFQNGDDNELSNDAEVDSLISDEEPIEMTLLMDVPEASALSGSIQDHIISSKVSSPDVLAYFLALVPGTFELIPSRWKSQFRLQDSTVTEKFQFLMDALKSSQSIHTLALREPMSRADLSTLFDVFRVNHSIASFDLSNSRIVVPGARSLADALKTNATLTVVNLEYSAIGSAGTQAVAEALQINTSITNINLAMNNIDEVAARALARMLKVNHSLATLDLTSNSVGDEGTASISDALQVNHTLTCLKLGENFISDDGIGALARALSVNQSIALLDLHGNEFQSEGLILLSDALKSNHSITVLNLNTNNDVGASGGKALASALEVNQTLQHLRLEDVKIGLPGKIALANSLKANHSLTAIDLPEDFGEKSTRALVSSFAVNTSLRTLTMREFGPDVGISLFDSLKTNHVLNSLYLIDCRFDSNGAEALAQALSLNQALTDFQLSKCMIDEAGISALFNALKFNSSLTRFALEGSVVSVTAMSTFAETLKANQCIKKLVLNGDHMGCASVRLLADALKFNHSLTSLHLEDNCIADDGARALAESLKVHPVISSCHLQGNAIGEEGQQALADASSFNSFLNISCKRTSPW